MTHLTTDTIKTFYQMIGMKMFADNHDPLLIDIVVEEVGAYLNGINTSEHAIANINNRVKLYLQEMR
jgi:hypothetical protein